MIVLDVKVGSGAFMKTIDEGSRLARLLVDIAQLAGRKAVALLSDINQPLGLAIGNALEVREANDTLHGGGPADFTEHCLVLAGYLLAIGDKAGDPQAGKELAGSILESGQAWELFRSLVQSQGGDLRTVDNPDLLSQANLIELVTAPKTGYLSKIDACLVGEAAMRLGAGREKKGQPVDHAVGVVIHNKVGDWVEIGQPLFTVYAADADRLSRESQAILSAYAWSDSPIDPLPLFYGVID